MGPVLWPTLRQEAWDEQEDKHRRDRGTERYHSVRRGEGGEGRGRKGREGGEGGERVWGGGGRWVGEREGVGRGEERVGGERGKKWGRRDGGRGNDREERWRIGEEREGGKGEDRGRREGKVGGRTEVDGYLV